MENWETCVCFCSFCFPCCYCQASPGVRVYGSTSVAKKIHFTSKKPTHTHVTYRVCLVRRSITSSSCHKAYLSSSQFSKKNRSIRLQLHLRKVPSVHSTCCKIFVRSLFREILIMPLLNFHDWLHFWKHLRHFC